MLLLFILTQLLLAILIIYLVAKLQRYLLRRYRNGWHLAALSATQLSIFTGIILWLWFEFDQGVKDGSIDGPAGMVTGGAIALMALLMLIVWLVNSVIALVIYIKSRKEIL